MFSISKTVPLQFESTKVMSVYSLFT